MTWTTGMLIAKLRHENNLTQEEFADLIGVTKQAVSKWENGVNLPDIEKYPAIAAALHTSTYLLLNPNDTLPDWILKDKMYSETSMFTRMRTIAQYENLTEANRALYYAREKHKLQLRKRGIFTKEDVPYIVHPLMMVLHAHAMGIHDDTLLAAILLHDVCEDCGVSPDELPFSKETRELVSLLTFPEAEESPEDRSLPKEERQRVKKEKKEALKKEYYQAISRNKKASLIKILDRCNNISTMAHCFSREKMIEYIQETEQYIYPLMKRIKEEHLEYNDFYFIINYHIQSVIESLKNMLERRGE